MKNHLLPTLFYLSLISPVTFASPLLCEDVFQAYTLPVEVAPEGSQALSTLKNLPDLLSPVLVPQFNQVKWNSFESIQSLKQALANYTEVIEKMTPAQRQSELRNFSRLVDQDPVAREFFDALAQPEKMDYRPSQYHLRKKLFAEVAAALKVLPKEFRSPVARVPQDQRLARINKDARAFMKEHVEIFDKYVPTTGYESYTAFEKTLRSSEDPYIKKAIELLDNHKLEVVMRRPEAGRFWIPITGIQNQYVSGSSKGFFGKDGRYGVESILTDRAKADYAKIDDEVKPKYGTLRIAEDTGVSNRLGGSSQYGSDVYTFKEEAIQNRLSVFIGDSLNHVGRIRQDWKEGRQGPASSWQFLFIPWSRRLLIVPYMADGLKNNHFGVPSEVAVPEMPVKNRSNTNWHQYWESQIFGRVTLDMVKTFEFEVNPPSPEFAAELKKYKIKIIDRRNRAEPKEWDGN